MDCLVIWPCGFADIKGYFIGSWILRDLTQKPYDFDQQTDKIYQLSDFGMDIIEHLYQSNPYTDYDFALLKIWQQTKMGHYIKY